MEAHELMQTKVLSLGSSSSLMDAAALMHDNNIRHLPIVESNEVVGIISERDLRGYLDEVYRSQAETPAGVRSKGLSIGSVMQAKPLCVDPSADIVDVIDVMLENKVGAVVVSDTLGQLRGIISYEDVLRGARDQLSAT